MRVSCSVSCASQRSSKWLRPLVVHTLGTRRNRCSRRTYKYSRSRRFYLFAFCFFSCSCQNAISSKTYVLAMGFRSKAGADSTKFSVAVKRFYACFLLRFVCISAKFEMASALVIRDMNRAESECRAATREAHAGI